ncbi:MAG TPA: redoxin domain-containing protein [Desulfomonilia bacterium]
MKKGIFLTALFLFVSAGLLNADVLKYSKEIGSIKLNVPEDKILRNYLGIKQKEGQFSIPEIRQGILIVEIFNMYCPHCQHYAPKVNELYTRINARADTKGRVMMLGIGVGNSPFEVNIFRKKYDVAFPLFDDKAYSVANKLEGVLTPHFFGMILDGKGGYRVFYSQNGGFENADEFLNSLLKLTSGIK